MYLANRQRLSRFDAATQRVGSPTCPTSMVAPRRCRPLTKVDRHALAGAYVKDGANRVIAQQTVVIPAKDGDG